MEELIAVQVMVPRGRLGAFHEFFGRWYQGTIDQLIARGDGAGPGISERPWANGTEDDQIQDAKYVYERISVDARRIVDYWLEHPGIPVKGRMLANQLNLAGSNAIPGTLSSLGRRSKEVGRKHPYTSEPDYGGGSFWMEPVIAEVFRRAREKVLKRVQTS